MRRTLLVLILAALALTGCGGPRTAGASPSPLPTGPLVLYARSGGLAGVDERLTVQPDGTYQVTRRGSAPRTGRLDAAELSELRRVLDQSHFADIPAVNPGHVDDGFSYHVVYAGHEVLAQDGGVPDTLRTVLAELDGLYQRLTRG